MFEQQDCKCSRCSGLCKWGACKGMCCGADLHEGVLPAPKSLPGWFSSDGEHVASVMVKVCS